VFHVVQGMFSESSRHSVISSQIPFLHFHFSHKSRRTPEICKISLESCQLAVSPSFAKEKCGLGFYGNAVIRRSFPVVNILRPARMVIAQSSLDDRCPVCKSDKYLNPNLKFLVNPECYHKL
jgi:Zinc finger, C3HC4 type (RING finger)